MKNVYFLFLFLLSSLISFSQLNYTVSFPKGLTFTPLTGATKPNLTLTYDPALALAEGVGPDDEGAANNVQLPFTFVYNCVAYNRCHISTNGFISFGKSLDSVPGYFYNNMSQLYIGNNPWIQNEIVMKSRPLIAPFWADLNSSRTTTAGSWISYKTSGTAPFRTFTVEWLRSKWNFLANSASISIQLQLNEIDNSIVFLYKSENGATLNPRASVGLTDCNTGLYSFLSLSSFSDSAKISNTIAYDTIKTRPITNFAIKLTPGNCSQIKAKSDCPILPIIKGNVFYDYNLNGKKDTFEGVASLRRIIVNNNKAFYTDGFGNYTATGDTLPQNVISVDSPKNYKAIPSSVTLNLSNFDTTVYLNFALQANTSFDSAQLLVVPIMWRPRPGFSYPFFIGHRNIGSTIISPTLNFQYDNTKLILDSINNPFVTKNGNNLSYQSFNMKPGEFSYFIAYFRVDSTTPLGDSIVTTSTLTYSDSLRLSSIVGGSYDPNDKSATPVLTPIQVANGKYIEYTIRFQNTGTDTAFNVFVTDTLSNNLLPNSMIVDATSHDCKTTIEGNVVKFTFSNIVLPDSNVNEIKSHGFIRFRMKPKPTLTNGDLVPNKAAIYFDYNAPVITNTCITQINTVGIVTPLKLISYKVEKNDRTALTNATLKNIWKTENELNVSHFTIQRSIDGRIFENISVIKANNKYNNSYSYSDEKSIIGVFKLEYIYYRIEIEDRDGKRYYSDIQKVDLKNNENKLFLYPNPSKSIVNIELKDLSKIEIYNNIGKQIFVQKVNNSIVNLNINSFEKGVYIIKAMDKNGKEFTSKFIKE